MLKRLGQQFRKSKQNKGKSEEKQPTTSQPTSAALLSSFLRRAVTGAEQIADSIKTKAQTEAKEEAGRIIGQARQEAEEIKMKAERATRKEAIVPESVEATTLQEEVAEEEAEQPVQLQEEATVSEPVEAATLQEEVAEEERPDRERTEPVPLGHGSQTLYTGEVELAISVPVDLKMVSKLYNYLQTTPEIKIVRTIGSWDQGTTITVVLDKPIPLISVISSKIPEVKATPERPEKDGFVKGKKGVRRIKLALKEG